jgi:hypothetical protein
MILATTLLAFIESTRELWGCALLIVFVLGQLALLRDAIRQK